MKKLIIIIIFTGLLFGFWQTAKAAELLLEYPSISEYGPTTGGFPGFIKYIYLFALGAVGIIALLAILIGAIMYITSAGQPDKMGEAKDRIMSAVLGVLILLASALILRTINPDLTEFGTPDLSISPGEQQTTAATCECIDNNNNLVPQGDYQSIAECIEACNNICLGPIFIDYICVAK